MMLSADQEATLREILATAKPGGAVAFGADTLRALLADLDAVRTDTLGDMLVDADLLGLNQLTLWRLEAGWQANAQVAGASGWRVAVGLGIEEALAGALTGRNQGVRRPVGLWERWMAALEREAAVWGEVG